VQELFTLYIDFRSYVLLLQELTRNSRHYTENCSFDGSSSDAPACDGLDFDALPLGVIFVNARTHRRLLVLRMHKRADLTAIRSPLSGM
jgi:hypothetical protein